MLEMKAKHVSALTHTNPHDTYHTPTPHTHVHTTPPHAYTGTHTHSHTTHHIHPHMYPPTCTHTHPHMHMHTDNIHTHTTHIPPTPTNTHTQEIFFTSLWHTQKSKITFIKIFLEHKECKISIRKFREVQRRKFALTPLQLAPQAHQGSFGPLSAPAASVSVFTYVHTQPQGFLLPQMGSYLGILGKVNSSSPQTLLRGPSISLQAMEAGPGRQTCRRAGAGSVGAGRPLATGQGTSPASLVKLQDTGETLCNSPPFLGSGRERSSCIFGKPHVFLAKPQAAGYHGWPSSSSSVGEAGPSPGPYPRVPPSPSGD